MNATPNRADEPDEEPTRRLLDAAVDALGGSRRDGQVAMAEAVSRALKDSRHLAVQAGTGTGKSLAYLVPAVRHAQETDTTVVVSTATLALQRQLVHRDLPRLVDALAPHLERRPTFAIQKGRSNYVCRQRLNAPEAPEGELFDAAELSSLERQVQKVRSWAADTETGDRDDLPAGVSPRAWAQVSVSSRECVGQKRCPFGEECFAELAREKARRADIVVTNHALLAIDAMSGANILPEHDAVIVDEAHELDGRVTSVATQDLTVAALKLAAGRAGRINEKTGGLEEAIDDLDGLLGIAPAGRWTEADDDATKILTGLRDELAKLTTRASRAPEGEAENNPERAAERSTLTNHLQELRDGVVRVLDALGHEGEGPAADVVWFSRDRGAPALSVAPLSVAGLMASGLFAENTVVLTSATLAVGGNFDAMAAAWGLKAGTWDALDVGTPFNPARSGILYVATSLPEPRRGDMPEETIEEICRLILAAGGRTLGLFSSKRAAQEAAERLRPRLPMDVLLQGEDSISSLVEAFAKQENTCLFGTLTLWQGVDVPGRSLSQVIIDKIPFPRPDEPLLKARQEAADAKGRSGFMEVAATHAALLLAQGAGRLIRSVSDRGVVSILDRRLVTKRYGGFLRASLPPFWATTDRDTVLGALGRLVAAPRTPAGR